MRQTFECQCRQVTGMVKEPKKAIRGVCFCKDCQAYARFLGHPDRVLNDSGGTDVVATQARYIEFSSGIHLMMCLSLREGGLLRWYSACCHTPIANCLRDRRVPFVGLVHTCLKGSDLDRSFHPVQMYLHTNGSRRPVGPHPKGKFAALVRFVPALMMGRIFGSYKKSPFFDPTCGDPIAMPKVLSAEELRAARSAA